MFKRSQISIILLAWFMATGAQWDLVQVFGWSSMIANHSRDMSLLNAVEKTFGGEMCSVCRAVRAAKQQDTPATVPKSKFDGKMLLVFQPAASIFLTVPDSEAWSQTAREPLSARRSAPPTPPPRV